MELCARPGLYKDKFILGITGPNKVIWLVPPINVDRDKWCILIKGMTKRWNWLFL